MILAQASEPIGCPNEAADRCESEFGGQIDDCLKNLAAIISQEDPSSAEDICERIDDEWKEQDCKDNIP